MKKNIWRRRTHRTIYHPITLVLQSFFVGVVASVVVFVLLINSGAEKKTSSITDLLVNNGVTLFVYVFIVLIAARSYDRRRSLLSTSTVFINDIDKQITIVTDLIKGSIRNTTRISENCVGAFENLCNVSYAFEEIVLYAGSRRVVKRKVKRFYNSVVDCFETCVDYRKKGVKNKAKLIAVQKKTENLRVELYNIYGAMHM